MENELIKVGFCVAYDWHLLQYAIPLIYQDADRICLSVDSQRFSWAGEKFQWDETEFRDFIAKIDNKNKVIVYEDDFHLPELDPKQNEVRQRNLMAEKMGQGGWHIQLDCDEYFLDFTSFITYLKSIPQKSYAFNVCCPLITLFKQTSSGYLYVHPLVPQNLEFIQIATRWPHYEFGRRNGLFNFYTNFRILHQSWARPEGEIEMKLMNWGHKNDFDSNRYFTMWKDLNDSNYTTIRNFHPVVPEIWPVLHLVNGTDLEQLIVRFRTEAFPYLSGYMQLIKNSRTVARMKKIKHLITKKFW